LNASGAAPAAISVSATTYAIDSAASAIDYHLVHKLHRVTGKSRGAQGKAAIQDGGKVVAVVFVPLVSFRSGDADRDARAHEILGSRGVSFVVFKGQGQLPKPGWTQPVELEMQGELTLHGVRRPLTVPVALDLGPGGVARVRGSFEVSLEAHEVERPSLLFVKVQDTCRIDLDLVLRDERR
jgi:polyisoprenoid-binding protein YceI